MFTTKEEKVACEAAPEPPRGVSFHVTLWPTFNHFARYSHDPRVQGIRLNSAMIEASELDDKFVRRVERATNPCWFDIKGMQLRVREALLVDDHFEFILNRPVKVKTPCEIYLKAGEDKALCTEIIGGTHFILAEGKKHGPKAFIKPGESIHISEPHEVGGPTFLDYEIEKIEKVKSLGIKKWYLSYVYEQRHVDEFRELIGPDAELVLKIENVAGLKYVSDVYSPMRNTRLMSARGDLWVEVPRKQDILKACKLVVEKDPNALVGSRMLLSIVRQPEADCADLFELAGLYDMGYRSFLLCDELCLKDEWLSVAVRTFDNVRKEYMS